MLVHAVGTCCAAPLSADRCSWCQRTASAHRWRSLAHRQRNAKLALSCRWQYYGGTQQPVISAGSAILQTRAQSPSWRLQLSQPRSAALALAREPTACAVTQARQRGTQRWRHVDQIRHACATAGERYTGPPAQHEIPKMGEERIEQKNHARGSDAE